MALVVATDLADERVSLIRFAAAVGKGGAVHLVHVVPAGLSEGERDARGQRLAAEAQELTEHGIQVHPRMETGDAAPVIVALAVESEASMIAMGGGAGLTRLGAVARAVVRSSPIPVLIARGVPDEIPTHLRVFVAVDLSPVSAAAVDWAGRILGSKVHLAHVWEPVALRARLGLSKVVNPEAPPAEVVVTLERDVRRAAGRDDLPVHLAAILPGEDPSVALLNLCARQGADIVVLGAHARADASSGSGVLEVALQQSTLPIVTIPDRVAEHQLPRMERVVVATDYSEVAGDAVAYAFALAGPTGAVHLVNVREPHFDGVDAERERDLAQRDRLMELVPEAGREAGTAVIAHPITGSDAARALASLAERIAADAIVVGGRPHGVVYAALVGSFVDDLLRRTTRPVLVVRPRKG